MMYKVEQTCYAIIFIKLFVQFKKFFKQEQNFKINQNKRLNRRENFYLHVF